MTFIFRIEYRDGTVREGSTSEDSISLALEYVNKLITVGTLSTLEPKPIDSIVSIIIFDVAKVTPSA